MLRGMVPALSGRRGGLIFRHAGRVELTVGGHDHECVKNPRKNGASMHREAKRAPPKKKENTRKRQILANVPKYGTSDT